MPPARSLMTVLPKMFRLTLVLCAGLAACVSGSTVSSDAKIVGGSATTIDLYPFQVSLQTSGSHFCGGTIYNSRFIVTAAHCVRAITVPTAIKIRYGSSYWASGGTLVGVVKYLVHPNYNATTMQYDIALLKTDAKIVWSSNVKSILLASTEPADNTAAKISGWGTLQSGATTIPSVLQAASLNIVSRSQCGSSTYGYRTSSIQSTMICAAASGIDTCQGDSGGPLVASGTLVGVVSWGSGCADSYYPGVYSSVAVLRSFVTTNVKLL